MKASTLFGALIPIDARSIGRDEMLRWMIPLPIVAALGVRWLMPPVVARLGSLLETDVAPFFSPLMGYIFLLLPAYFWGVVIGFLLLDQKDDRTLVALQVTPLSLHGYLVYRLAVPLLVSILVTPPAYRLTGLPPHDWVELLQLALVAAPQAPLFALGLAALARNKVQGLALTKAAGVLLLPPAIAYFLPSVWRWPFALFPTYWPAHLLWAVQQGVPTSTLLWFAALIYQGLLLALLARRFGRIMHRE